MSFRPLPQWTRIGRIKGRKGEIGKVRQASSEGGGNGPVTGAAHRKPGADNRSRRCLRDGQRRWKSPKRPLPVGVPPAIRLIQITKLAQIARGELLEKRRCCRTQRWR